MGRNRHADARPPCDPDSERAVIGSILVDAGCLVAIERLIRPEDFSEDRLGLFYGRLLALAEAGMAIGDTVILVDALRASGDWGRIGGAATMADCAHAVPVACHAVHYAEIVVEKSFRRRLIRSLALITQRCYDPGRTVDDLRGSVRSLCNKVSPNSSGVESAE